MTTPRGGDALPRIVQVGDPVLRAVAAPVTAEEVDTEALRDLVATMVRVMRAAPGVGLAAPQIGVSKQVIVFEDREELMPGSAVARSERERTPIPLTAVANPKLTRVESARVTFVEGCLSVTGFTALVPRALEVVVTGLDITGPRAVPGTWRLRGWPARILQHEVDHLRGALYVDRMHSRSLCSPDEAHRWAGRSTAEIAAALGVDLTEE